MEVWGRSQPLGNFGKNKAILMPLDHVLHVFRAISKNSIINMSKPVKKIKLFNPPFTHNLNVSDLAQVEESKIHWLVLYFSGK